MLLRKLLPFNKNILAIAKKIEAKNQYFGCYFSSAKYSYSGNKSFIFWGLEKEITTEKEITKQISSKEKPYLFGYFSYEAFMDKELEDIGARYLDFPDIYFFQAKNILIFDQQKQTLEFLSNDQQEFDRFSIENLELEEKESKFSIKNLSSNMSKNQYLEKVEKIRQDIENGDYYQANLTRKFYGKIENADNFSIFEKLTGYSPSPYSAYFKFAKKTIISSSPEIFLNIENDRITSRPIKGTIAREENLSEKEIINKLKESKKDQAENLMIVDLMRNDLSKSSISGTVKVDKLFAIDCYKTLCHMSSHITSKKQKGLNNLQIIKNSHPPASMTGAPKKAVIEALKELEQAKRGVYSGALGYFNAKDQADFSVIIRTLLIEGNKFEFQVGGGITYDSTANGEYLETITKAKAILQSLGIDENEIMAV